MPLTGHSPVLTEITTTPSSLSPNTALIVRPDTLGDLVLFAPVLRCLREAWPETRLAVVIRRPYLDLAQLLVPGILWITTDLDPFVRGPNAAGKELERLRKAVAVLAPELVVAACPRRNWLDTVLSAAAPSARHVAFASSEEDLFFGAEARLALGPRQAPDLAETAAPAPGERDWERNYGLAEHLLGRTVPHAPPTLAVDPARLGQADELLRARGLEPGHFVACGAAGFANVRIKTWSADRYAATIGWLLRSRGRRTLLIGHKGEQAYLETLRVEAGADAAEIWTGGDGDLPTMAALLARSELYFGNDTGAMHLAAALDRAIVAVFGGGTWPRFQPAARQAISLVNPLPCFGCGWDCPFGDAPCVQAVGQPEVQGALGDALDRLGQAFNEVRRTHGLPYTVAAFMGRTEALVRERTAAHIARERKLVETTFLARERDVEIKLKEAEIHSKEAEMRLKEAEIHSKEAEIVALKAATDEKDAALKAKEVEIAGLTRACEERLQLIIRLDADLKRMDAELHELRKQAPGG